MPAGWAYLKYGNRAVVERTGFHVSPAQPQGVAPAVAPGRAEPERPGLGTVLRHGRAGGLAVGRDPLDHERLRAAPDQQAHQAGARPTSAEGRPHWTAVGNPGRGRRADRGAALRGKSASAIAALLEAEGVSRPTERSKAWHHSHVIAAFRRVEARRRSLANRDAVAGSAA